ALLASVPVVAFVQDIPTQGRDRNALQELDHEELFRSCSKWTRQLTDVSRVDDYIDMALVQATSGRPGPVVLLLPKDVMIDKPMPSPFPRTSALGRFPLDRPSPDPKQIQK